MESLSWLNMLIAAIVLAAAAIYTLPGWSFWTAVLVGVIVVALEGFDEWSERDGREEEVVGPEAVVVLAGLWLAISVLVTGGPTTFVALAFVAGFLIATGALLNAIASYRMDPTGQELRGR